MSKKINLIAIVFIVFLSSTLFALDGNWKLDTQIMQIMENGVTVGFANPEGENQIETILFNGDKSVITYNGKEYEAGVTEENSIFLFSEDAETAPVAITLLSVDENTFRFSYNLANAKENLRTGVNSRAFINYFGIMEKIE